MFGVIFFNYYINGAPKCNEYIHLARAPICKEYIHLARAHKCYRESTFSYGRCCHYYLGIVVVVNVVITT